MQQFVGKQKKLHKFKSGENLLQPNKVPIKNLAFPLHY